MYLATMESREKSLNSWLNSTFLKPWFSCSCCHRSFSYIVKSVRSVIIFFSTKCLVSKTQECLASVSIFIGAKCLVLNRSSSI